MVRYLSRSASEPRRASKVAVRPAPRKPNRCRRERITQVRGRSPTARASRQTSHQDRSNLVEQGLIPGCHSAFRFRVQIIPIVKEAHLQFVEGLEVMPQVAAQHGPAPPLGVVPEEFDPLSARPAALLGMGCQAELVVGAQIGEVEALL